MDEKLTFKTPPNLTVEQSSTLGVASLTACLGWFEGCNIPLIDLSAPAEAQDEWVIVFGGSSAVGQSAIQLVKGSGYKVVTTGSPRNEELLKKLGADAVINYTKSEDEQLADLASITSGKFSKALDIVNKNYSFAAKLFDGHSKLPDKVYVTTDDWSPLDPLPDAKMCRIALGPIGRTGKDISPKAPHINQHIESFIPVLSALIESGRLKPQEIESAGQGFEAIPKAVELVGMGKGGAKKFVVKLA